MKERRKLKRRHLVYYSRVFDRHTGELLGHLVDINAIGAMLISDKPLKVGEVHHLRMDVPEDIIGTPYLSFDARSLWCRPDINPDFFDTGFELLDMEEKTVAVIEKMIAEYGFRD